MKKEILELRNDGKSYRDIELILGCSKSTISYHCGAGQKEKSKKRLIKSRRNARESLKCKIDGFLRNKVRGFKRGYSDEPTNGRASYDSFYKKIENSDICYLSGRKIDLSSPRSYSLDHIQPTSKGGKNTLSNCGISTRDANKAKSDMSVDEFILLCVDVCRYNGYDVIEKK